MSQKFSSANFKQFEMVLICGFIGDALGSFLEFDHNITSEKVEKALSMPGGGHFNTAPGQSTDDSEMQCFLINTLVNHDPTNGYPVFQVHESYRNWLCTSPFDVGMTTHRGLSFDYKDNEKFQDRLLMASEANGSLMRCAPIALWAKDLDSQTIFNFAKQDSSFTHPNMVCVEICGLYCVAIALLLKNESLETVKNELLKLITIPKIKEWLNLSFQHNALENYDALHHVGHCKHAFIIAFHLLMFENNFIEGMRKTLQLKGDTDTNACIVASLLGAKLYNSKDIEMVINTDSLVGGWIGKVKTAQTRPTYRLRPAVCCYSNMKI